MMKRIIRKVKSIFFSAPFGTQNSVKRNEWLQNKLMEIPAGKTILDAGAGSGSKKKFCGHLNYISQDIALYDGLGQNRGLHTGHVDYSNLDIVSDIIDIPLENNSVDAIMCTEVLEHVEDPLLVFKEFSRILKKGGKLIITAPFNSLTHYAPYHYSTGFSKYYYETHLPKFNFQIEEIKDNGNYFEYFAQELRRLDEVSKTYGKKKYTSFLFHISKLYLLNYLKRQNKNDINSAELLCFGYFVSATKN